MLLVQLAASAGAGPGPAAEREVEELTAEIVRLRPSTRRRRRGPRRVPRPADRAPLRRPGGVDFARELLEAVARAGQGRRDPRPPRRRWPRCRSQFLRRGRPRQLLSVPAGRAPADHRPGARPHDRRRRPRPVLSGLAAERQADVAHRIAVMDRTSPEIVRLVEADARAHGSRLVLQPSDMATVGGVQPLVDIINRADRGHRAAHPRGAREPRPRARRGGPQPACSCSRTSSASTTAPSSWCCARSRPRAGRRAQGRHATRSATRSSATCPSAPARTSSRRSSCSARCASRTVEEAQAEDRPGHPHARGAGQIVIRRGERR